MSRLTSSMKWAFAVRNEPGRPGRARVEEEQRYAPLQGLLEIPRPCRCRDALVYCGIPGVRFAHPRLISFRPAGADYVTVMCLVRQGRSVPRPTRDASSGRQRPEPRPGFAPART